MKNYIDLSNCTLIPKSKFNVKNIPIICDGNRSTHHIIKGNADSPLVFTHQNCMCNVEVACYMRHMRHYSECSEDGVNFYFDTVYPELIKKTISSFPNEIQQPLSYDEVINRYHGKYRKRYINALQKINADGLSKKDFICSSFIKDDKYHQDTLDSEIKYKPPRLIQAQHPKGTLAKARYILPIEHAFYELLDNHGMRVFTKGLNQIEVAQLLFDGYNSIEDPVVAENDYVAFDSHVNVQWLKYVAEYIISCAPVDQRPFLRWMLKQSIKVHGYAKGIKYFINGTLTSGSIETSFTGNFVSYVIMLTMLTFIRVPKTDYKFVCNGDDSVLFISRKHLDKLLKFDMKLFGMDAKMIIRKTLWDMEFCQSKLIMTPVGPNMVRNPNRIFTRLGWLTKYRSPKIQKQYLKTVIMGEMALNFMVPIIYPTLQRMLHQLDKRIKPLVLDTYHNTLYFNDANWAKDIPYVYGDEYDDNLYRAYPDFIPIDHDFMAPIISHLDDYKYSEFNSLLLKRQLTTVTKIEANIYKFM